MIDAVAVPVSIQVSIFPVRSGIDRKFICVIVQTRLINGKCNSVFVITADIGIVNCRFPCPVSVGRVSTVVSVAKFCKNPGALSRGVRNTRLINLPVNIGRFLTGGDIQNRRKLQVAPVGFGIRSIGNGRSRG